jgi:His-Xaa-Ser system protein HxsD
MGGKMSNNVKKEGGLVLDAAVYSGEALRLAAYVFSDKAEVTLTAKKGFFEISFGKTSAGFLPGDYLNEALNQQCRLDLAAKNSKAAGMIATKALLSAAGDGGKKAKK